MDDISS